MPLKQTTGSRAQVMHGTAKKTSGGLTKSQLKYNKQGKIVSKKASALAKKNNRLVKAGYITRKGQFGVSMRGGGLTAKTAELLEAIKKNKNGDEIRSLLVEGANASEVHTIYDEDDKLERTPLHYACNFPKKKLEVVKALIDNLKSKEKIEALNTGDEDNQTPLHYSTINKFHDISSLLINSGANPNIPEKELQRTPLHFASSLNDVEGVKILLGSPDIDKNVRNWYGDTALNIAEKQNYHQIIELLK